MEISAKDANLISKCPLFSSLDEKSLEELISLFKKISYPQHSFIVNENEKPHDLLILAEGEAEIIKFDQRKQKQHRLAVLKKGDIVGELSFLDNQPRSASVKTLVPTKTLTISYTALNHFLDRHKRASKHIYLNLSKAITTRLKLLNETTVKTLQLQIKTARFMVSVILMTFLYIFSLHGIAYLAQSITNTTFISIPLLIVFVLLTLLAIRNNGLPLSTYGLTLKNARKSAIRAIVYSIPILLFLIYLKWLAINYLSAFEGAVLFEPGLGFKSNTSVSTFMIVGIWLAYYIGIPLQEFISRGALQGSLQVFLTGRYNYFFAILISSLQFSLMHMPLSGWFAIVVFPLGLFWGWLFSKDNTLVGVTLSHIIIGIWAFEILNLSRLFF